jgi:oxygen-independent coproporphyrinogen-3 oxidase
LYLKALNQDELPSEYEVLTTADRYNEYIMTGLRTIWGVSLDSINNKFGEKYLNYLNQMTEKHLQNKLLVIENDILKTTDKGRFLTDGIASDLFFVTLK